MSIPRRAFLGGVLAAGAASFIGACGDDSPSPTGNRRSESGGPGTGPPGTGPPGTGLEPTPACTAGNEPTLVQTEGPYFTPDSPERTSLLADAGPGTRLVLSGSVLDTSCRPVSRALLDFWQADAGGNYDNDGYRLRGHLFTDGTGRYRLETIVPGRYPGRTRHIHVKVQPPGGQVLTTQLYFPGEPQNSDDAIFRPALVMQVSDATDGKNGAFTFVVRT